MPQYENLDDSQLIALLRAGDPKVMDYLMEKYKNLVRKKANRLFLFGGDTDDLIQEGMIGLFKAVRDFNEQSGSFYQFADLCISRQLYTAIASAARKKHGPLNSYVSLSDGEADQASPGLQKVLYEECQNPEQMMIDRENADDFLDQLTCRLSRMEQTVLDYHLEGMNYRKIAVVMGKSEKSIDNALQRIRKKAQEIFTFA